MYSQKRKITKRNIEEISKTIDEKDGVVSTFLCINPIDDITYGELNPTQSTIFPNAKFWNAVFNMKYEVDSSAPSEECGVYTVNINSFGSLNPIPFSKPKRTPRKSRHAFYPR